MKNNLGLDAFEVQPKKWYRYTGQPGQPSYYKGKFRPRSIFFHPFLVKDSYIGSDGFSISFKITKRSNKAIDTETVTFHRLEFLEWEELA